MTKLKPIVLLLGLASAGLSASALAAEAASPHTLTANVGLYSQYVFRGLAQTNEDIAVQGGFDYSHSSGFYLGTWASNISWLSDGGSYSSGGSVEVDLYGGYRGTIGDFGFDVGLLQYFYPGDVASGFVDADTLEAYVAGSWKWFTVKYSYALSDDVFGVTNADGTSYWDFSASVPLGDTGLTLGAHYGIQEFDGSASNDDLYSYEDWKISMTYDLGKASKTFSGMTLGVAYTDTSSANNCGYGSTRDSGTNAGTACTGVYPKNIADSQTTVWVSKSF